ncbi:hypothetical protein [Streptomyces sp. NPDC054887]
MSSVEVTDRWRPAKGSPRADAVLTTPGAGSPVLFEEVYNGTENRNSPDPSPRLCLGRPQRAQSPRRGGLVADPTGRHR